MLMEMDPRLRELWGDLEGIISGDRAWPDEIERDMRREPINSPCAWYCPIHFFSHRCGIYIKEECILNATKKIALFVKWQSPNLNRSKAMIDLLKSAFYVFFLHEQFHHKVESFGIRALVTTGSDRYVRYKSQVYRPTYLTANCLEESLANSQSYCRLGEERYRLRVQNTIRDGVREYLKIAIPRQPPGYAEGRNLSLIHI